MAFSTFRRYHLDKFLFAINFYGKVLDVGGNRNQKRGDFRPPIASVECWHYLNIEPKAEPDYLSSADKMPIENCSYDNIIMTEVLEHLEKPNEVLSECNRVLKKKGKIYLTIPFLYPVHADPYDFQRWTPEKIKMELTKAGFDSIQILPMGGVFSTISDLLYITLMVKPNNKIPMINRIVSKIFRTKPIVKLFLWLDKIFYNHITEGYSVQAIKN